MWWNVYISRHPKLFQKSEKHRVYMPKITEVEAAVEFASRKFEVDKQIVMCIPTGEKELS